MRMFPGPNETDQDFIRDWLRYLADSLERGDCAAHDMSVTVDEDADLPTFTLSLRIDAPHLHHWTMLPEAGPAIRRTQELADLLGIRDFGSAVRPTCPPKGYYPD